MSSTILIAGALFLLVALSAGGLLLVAFYPKVAGGPSVKRLGAVAASGKPAARRAVNPDARRKRSVEETLRELEEKQRTSGKRRAKPSLITRMRQGGLGWSKTTYLAVSAAAGIACFLLASMGLGLGVLTAAGFAVTGALLLPHLYVGFRRKGRFKRFSAEFPNAVDVIVRGIKSGLPLADCFKIIAAEAQEPVRSEFQTVVQDQTMGIPMDEAVERMAERLPIAEANFFAIVIAIQSRTGGSLSEALGNLSRVLRERRKMQGKIRAMSSEAKASAGIIGALPVAVTGMIYVTSPDYISLLFTTLTGNLVLAVSGFWMLLGTLVMRKMINFDF